MKNLIFIFLFILIISGISFSADPAVLDNSFLSFFTKTIIENDDSQVINKEFKVTPGKLLDIDLKTGGTINIQGWDKSEVSVKASLHGKDWKNINVEIEENSGDVTIYSNLNKVRHNNKASVDLEVFVPNKFNIKLETMGGNVTLKNIEGEVTGQTMGGNLDLSNLKGSLDLKTMGGGIDLKDSDVEGKVETMGGYVVFDNVAGGIQGSSMGGNVEYRNAANRGESSSDKEIVISTMGGEINLDKAPNGARVSTMGGNISVNSASKFVKASTMGGNVTVNEVNGDIDASTMSGDVEVKVLGDSKTSGRDIHLVSMNGDVIIKLPKDFSMDIDARLENDTYEITSDFPISQNRFSRDEDSDDVSVHGTGKIAGGDNMVKLEAKNGNIRIESY